MRKLPNSLLSLALLMFATNGYAAGNCAGLSNCDDNQINAQAQGQGQGQLQGQDQGQLQGQGQNQNAYGGRGGSAYQGQAMQQGQIGINKNDNKNIQGQIGINKNSNKNVGINKNYNDSYANSRSKSNSKAVAVQGQLQGNIQGTKVNIKSDASGNSVPAFAPSISSRSTTTCITTYAGSGGGGGAGGASIFSLGLSVPIRDEDCVMEQMIRTGFESNSAAAQAKAEELYLHRMDVMAEQAGHDTVAQVIDKDGNVAKVMYSDDLEAFIPVERHPKYIRAASVAYVDMLLQAGYTPNVNPINGDGFHRVSFPMGDSMQEMLMDEDLVESVLRDIDDERQLSDGAKDR